MLLPFFDELLSVKEWQAGKETEKREGEVKGKSESRIKTR